VYGASLRHYVIALNHNYQVRFPCLSLAFVSVPKNSARRCAKIQSFTFYHPIITFIHHFTHNSITVQLKIFVLQLPSKGSQAHLKRGRIPGKSQKKYQGFRAALVLRLYSFFAGRFCLKQDIIRNVATRFGPLQAQRLL